MRTLIAAVSVLALLGSPVLAETAARTGAQGEAGAAATASGGTKAENLPADLRRASRLLDRDVHGPNGEDIGEIEDLVLDAKTGKVDNVIVSVGGFLGVGDKLVALKWNQLRLEEVDARAGRSGPAEALVGTLGPRFVTDLTRDQLAAAPEFRFDAEAKAGAGR